MKHVASRVCDRRCAVSGAGPIHLLDGSVCSRRDIVTRIILSSVLSKRLQ